MEMDCLTLVEDAKKTVLEWIDCNEKMLSAFDQQIWEYAEPAWREYNSARAYCDLLRQQGFEAIEGTGDMPTAFKASFGDGKPVLGTFAEYDAVPGCSQKAVPYRAPRDGFHQCTAGHTDPHSALGVGALAGILATKASIEEHGLPGKIVIFGEPAEKVCGSKPVHATKGFYDGFDIFIVFHPWDTNSVCWETQSGAYWNAAFTFECEAPETWISQPQAIPGGRAPAALDAVCLMYTTTKYTKEAMLPHTGLWTLNETILVAGQCTSDNITPRISQITYAWRSPTLDMQEQIYKVLVNNAEAVAKATWCNLSIEWVTKTRIGLFNQAVAEVTYWNLEQVGPPQYGEEAKQFAHNIQKNIGIKPMEEPFTVECQTLMSPKEWERQLRTRIPPWQQNLGSDDYVEYTWHAPTARLYVARATLKPTEKPYPMWTRLAMSGYRPTIDPMIFITGKTIGTSLVEYLTSPNEVKRANDEFVERTGGGIGGSKWVPPLLPKDFHPPIGMRWPEYIQTDRGTEWWIPTSSTEKNI